MKTKDNILDYAIVFLVSSKRNLHIFFTSLMLFLIVTKLSFFFNSMVFMWFTILKMILKLLKCLRDQFKDAYTATKN